MDDINLTEKRKKKVIYVTSVAKMWDLKVDKSHSFTFDGNTIKQIEWQIQILNDWKVCTIESKTYALHITNIVENIVGNLRKN
jgi:hypothetical protein